MVCFLVSSGPSSDDGHPLCLRARRSFSYRPTETKNGIPVLRDDVFGFTCNSKETLVKPLGKSDARIKQHPMRLGLTTTIALMGLTTTIALMGLTTTVALVLSVEQAQINRQDQILAQNVSRCSCDGSGPACHPSMPLFWAISWSSPEGQQRFEQLVHLLLSLVKSPLVFLPVNTISLQESKSTNGSGNF